MKTILLRSSSTPILNSWLPPNYTNSNSSPTNVSEHMPSLARTNSVSTRATSSPSSCPSPSTDHSKPAVCTLFDTDLQNPPWPKTTRLQRLFSSSGLDDVPAVTYVDEDGGIGDGGGSGSGSSGGDGGGAHGGGGSGGFYDHNSNNSNNIDKYYQRMIKANPGDPLLLGNYARFLKEVRGDLGKAEECCGRAILVSPSDANLLSMYADIIWQDRRDAQRAETYFDQAIKAAPDDCYVHASYAKFLWDVEEEDVGEDGHQRLINEDFGNTSPSPPHFLEGTFHRSPLPTR